MLFAQSTVLVVEDEWLLRMAAVHLMGEAGFETAEAADGAEAIDILESRTDIRIVFSDIDMPPGINGLKLAALVRDRWPPVHIILTSGHAEPAAREVPLCCRFFPKPYKGSEIVEAARLFLS